MQPLALIVDELRVFLVGRVAVGAGRVLQLGDRVRRPHVVLAADAVLVFAAGIERVAQQRGVAERELVQPEASSATSNSPMPSMLLAVPVKYLSTKALLQSDRLEDLRAAIGLVGGDAHLGHHLVAGPCRSP